MEQLFFLLLNVGLSAIIAMLGKKRKIGYWWSFAFCLVLSPVIGLIITLYSKRKDIDFVNMDN